MPITEQRLRRVQHSFWLAFLGSAGLTLALSLVVIWAEIPPEGLLGKSLGSAAMIMLVSALGTSASRLMRD